MPKDDIKLDPDFFSKIQELKDKTKEQEIDVETQRAIESLDFANQIINAVSSGKQIDMAFFRLIQEEMIKRLNQNMQSPERPRKKVKKVKKLYKQKEQE